MLSCVNSAPGGVLEAYELFSAVAPDFVTAYLFGIQQSSNFTGDSEAGRKWLRDYKSRGPYPFWLQEMPNVFRLFSRFGHGQFLVPERVGCNSMKIEDDCLRWCDAAEDVIASCRSPESPGDHPTVYGQMRTKVMQSDEQAAVEKANRRQCQLTQEQRLDVASEMLDHLAAGFDTTGTSLTYLAWELSHPHNTPIQKRLREELRSLSPDIQMARRVPEGLTLPEFESLDDLSLLHAVVMETLRLHAAIPGGQSRVTPTDATLGPPGAEVHSIPAGVRVVSAAYSLHRRPNVFLELEKWCPERWLDSHGRVDSGGDKGRWFWTFGSGSRMCIGSNLAMTEMKGVVAALWSSLQLQLSMTLEWDIVTATSPNHEARLREVFFFYDAKDSTRRHYHW